MTTNILPQNPDWEKVERFILENWEKSRVDPQSPIKPGSVKLPKPYLSIAVNHHLLFYWDNYFINAGLLLVNELRHYALNVTENLLFLVEQMGYVPNATEPWGLNRSQIPFLSLIVREVYETLKTGDREWLRRAYATLKKDYQFWTNTNSNQIEDHQTSIAGLQRYSHHATPAEMLTFFDEIAPRFEFGDLTEAEKLQLAENWLAEAEAGVDFTPRFENRCTHFVPICLNSNLFTYEMNFHWMVNELKLTGEPDWEQLAEQRAKLINAYLWNEQRGLYLDYDFKNKRHSKVASIITFFPMLAGIASPAQAKRIVDNLPLFEYEYGVTVCEQTNPKRQYQWDYPAGWPPTYCYVVMALDKYGFKKEAARIAEKYLNIVTRNFNAPQPVRAFDPESKRIISRTKGKIYEKYNVVTGEIYDAEYPANEFFGWSAGVFIYLKNYLTKLHQKNL